MKDSILNKLAWALLLTTTLAAVLCTISAYANDGISGTTAMLITLVCMAIEFYALKQMDK